MGLKLLTLALCAVEGRLVKVHDKSGALPLKARVLAHYDPSLRNIVYSLQFGDGKIKPVTWSQDNQGYVTEDGAEVQEEEESVVI